MLKNILAHHAAVLEAEQAERDFSEAYNLNLLNGHYGSPEDYAVWSTSAYADTAARLVRDMPVWEA